MRIEIKVSPPSDTSGVRLDAKAVQQALQQACFLREGGDQSADDLHDSIRAALKEKLQRGADGLDFVVSATVGPFPCLPLKRSKLPLKECIPRPGGNSTATTATEGEKSSKPLQVVIAFKGFNNVKEINTLVKLYAEKRDTDILIRIADVLRPTQQVHVPLLSTNPLTASDLIGKYIEAKPEDSRCYNQCATRLGPDEVVTVHGEPWDRVRLLRRAIELDPSAGTYYTNLAVMGMRPSRSYPLQQEEAESYPTTQVVIHGEKLSSVDMVVRALEKGSTSGSVWSNLGLYLPPSPDALALAPAYARTVQGKLPFFPHPFSEGGRDGLCEVRVGGELINKAAAFRRAVEISPELKNAYAHFAHFRIRHAIHEVVTCEDLGAVKSFWRFRIDEPDMMAGAKMTPLDMLKKALAIDIRFFPAWNHLGLLLTMESAVAGSEVTCNINGSVFTAVDALVAALRAGMDPSAKAPPQRMCSIFAHLGTAIMRPTLTGFASNDLDSPCSHRVDGDPITARWCFDRGMAADEPLITQYLSVMFGGGEEWLKALSSSS